MADLSDVLTYLAGRVEAAVYPNGTSQPSIAPAPVGFSIPMDVRIFEGWPIPDQLDLDLAGTELSGTPPVPTPRANGPCANVSIFPLPGQGLTTYQILDDTFVQVPVSYGLTVAVVGNQITITGTPVSGEYVTIVADRGHIYSRGGASAAAILAALLADVQVNYQNASVSGSTLTIPFGYQLDVRQGGVATLAKVTHRQCHQIAITVWAPDHNTRSVLANAIDVLLKQKIVVTLADTTQVKIVYSRTMQTDEHQNVTAYRRDLVYECEYATLQTFPGYQITSVSTSVIGMNQAPTNQPTALVVN